MTMRSLKDDEKNMLGTLYNNSDQFQDELKSIVERGFAIEDEVAKESLLFISMNPSYSKDGAWNNGTGERENAIYKIPKLKDEKNPEETNSFFQAINRFYKELNFANNIPPLAHHDLLFIRETDQKIVLKWKKKLEQCSPDFFSKQLDLSKTIIEESEPKLIVVLNAGARELFKELFNDDCNPSFCDKLGANIYTINGNKTPVLFSGMLSGQRALDLGSQESLKWHIKYILKQIEEVNA